MKSLNRTLFNRCQSTGIEYSLDVLTDGSECTGHGTIFLTVYRSPKLGNITQTQVGDYSHEENDRNSINDDQSSILKESTIKARYALTGLSSLTSRLASDQNFKLSPIRLLLCSSLCDISSKAGIPSLLLALSNNSLTGELSVVGPEGIDSYMDEMVNLIIGKRRKYPRVSSCNVPAKKKNERDVSVDWWKVFEDEFILVHARTIVTDRNTQNSGRDNHDEGCIGTGCSSDESSVSSTRSSSHDSSSCSSKRDGLKNEECEHADLKQSIVYIVTLCCTSQTARQSPDKSRSNYSFAVLPPGIDSISCYNTLHPLPDIVKSLHEPLRFVLHIDTKKDHIIGPSVSSTKSENKCTTENDGSFSSLNPHGFFRVHPKLLKLAKHHLTTIPNDNKGELDNILIRASYRAKVLHNVMPFAFPLRKGQIYDDRSFQNEKHTKGHSSTTDNLDDLSIVPFHRLSSCTSNLLLYVHSDDKVLSNRGQTAFFFTIYRNLEIQSRTESKECVQLMSTISENNKNFHQSLSRLAKFYSEIDSEDAGVLIPIKEANYDTDEIDLSEASDSESSYSVPCKRTKRDKIPSLPDSSTRLEPVGFETDVTKAYFLFLGTGCASPSPMRGSSGYAVLLPTMSLEPQCSTLHINSSRVSRKWKHHLSLSALVECGEGTLTSLSRFLPMHCNVSRNSNYAAYIAQIRFIWISHAHLDHYAELPIIVEEINYARLGDEVCTCLDIRCPERHMYTRRMSSAYDGEQNSIPKCPWCHLISPPIVIAPPKVLRFLDLSLNCRNGYRREGIGTLKSTRGQGKSKTRIYVGISNRDFDTLPWAQQVRDSISGFDLVFQEKNCNGGIIRKYRPFSLVRSIPVEHCPDACALLLGLNTRIETTNASAQTTGPSLLSVNQYPLKSSFYSGSLFHICYSGDTRPSSNLVRACHQITNSGGQISLLIHEATFDDDEKGKYEAINKHHSTVQEAIGIAEQINCKGCILTHFSQRYPKLPPGYKVYQRQDSQQSFDSTNPTLLSAKLRCLGVASDGMMVPLTNSFASIIPLLSQCLIQVLEFTSEQTSSQQ